MRQAMRLNTGIRGNDCEGDYNLHSIRLRDANVELKIYDEYSDHPTGSAETSYYTQLSIETHDFLFKNRFNNFCLEVFFIFLEQASKVFSEHLNNKKEKEAMV